MRKILISLDKRIALLLVLILIAINLIFFLLIKPSISYSNRNNSYDHEKDEILFRQDSDTYIDENRIQTDDALDLDDEKNGSFPMEDTSADQESNQDQPNIERTEEDNTSDGNDDESDDQTPPPQPVPFEE